MNYKEWLEKVKDMPESELEQYLEMSDSEFAEATADWSRSSGVPHN